MQTDVEKQITQYFTNISEEKPNISTAIAAMQTLLHFMEKYDQSTTLSEMNNNLNKIISLLSKTDASIASVQSGCKLFLRFITPQSLDEDYNKCKMEVLRRSYNFLKTVEGSRLKIAKLGIHFVLDGCNILTHCKSRVVYETIKEASKAKKRFHVYVTESFPDSKGKEFCKQLTDEKIPCTLILDSAIGYVMEKIDLVMVGAEGVMESGGIINRIGTYTMAVCARALNKPFYVMAESFKFLREYPLSQRDVPNEFKFMASTLRKLSDEELTREHPLVDYTPPAYITLLFTDLGILTPSAVSDQLIQLYM